MKHVWLAFLLLPLAAAAQPPAPAGSPDEQPAISGEVDAEPAAESSGQPAIKRSSSVAPMPAAPAARKAPQIGVNVVGERESPIGLFITPWRNASAEKDIDRPARLLQEELLPMDEDVFVRQTEYYEALSGALKEKNAVTPHVDLMPVQP